MREQVASSAERCPDGLHAAIRRAFLHRGQQAHLSRSRIGSVFLLWFTGREQGSVDILACTAAITQFLPADLAAFGHANDQIRLNIQEVYSSEIVGRVRAGEAQVGVILEEPGTVGLDTWKYRCDRLAVVAPPHLLFGTHSVRFQDLAEHEFVQMGYDTANTRLLARAAEEQGWSFRLRAAVDSYDAVCRMIQAGFGIGVLPSEAAKNFIVPMGLKLVELDEVWAERQMLLTANGASLTSPARLLIDFLVERSAGR